ncbi:MAG: YitT family protein, partial [Lachnospiraceae bacterium]|nr:YitT family protein [Lachnospiraceae bacterium]
MKSFFVREKVKQYICVLLGTLAMAVAVVMFFDATGVVVGGVTGIAIILKNLFG